MMRLGIWVGTIGVAMLAEAACDSASTQDDPTSQAGGAGRAITAGAGSSSGAGGKASAGAPAGGTMANAGRGGTKSLVPGAGSAAASGAGATDDMPSVTLRFKATVHDQDFACGRTYTAIGSTHRSATAQDFRFFVHDVQLETSDGKSVPFTLDERSPVQSQGVGLVDFTDDTAACGAFGDVTNTQLTGHAPTANYTGISFVIGVPETLNHGDPVMAKAPLNDPSATWGWQSGYRFLMAEILRTDTDEGGADAGEPTDPLTLVHVGSAACSGAAAKGFTCLRANRAHVSLTGFDPTHGVVVADLGRLFDGVDLGLGVQCHGTAPECKPMYDALGIDIATGNTLATQQVFHAESAP